MERKEVVYIPGNAPPPHFPLNRYLPLVPEGIIETWLKRNLTTGSWLFDPFGGSPLTALETARNGYRILIVENNPILRLVIEILAGAYQDMDFRKALASLAMIRLGDGRLETELRRLYETECAACKSIIPVTHFIWNQNATSPSVRQYTCPNCGDSGEYPLTANDHKRLAAAGNAHLNRARALQLGAVDDPKARETIQEAVDAYPSRPLYFLFTLINKLRLQQMPENQRKLLEGLSLSVCDQANCLWPWPTERERPRQITTPTRYQEFNLWAVFENAVSQWQLYETPIPVTYWPELPPESGGICIYAGRATTLETIRTKIVPRAVLTVFPRINQAFWTFSALWAGWLWGEAGLNPMKSSLERQRYDWQWYGLAVQNVFNHLNQLLPNTVPFFGLISETETGFATAVLNAGEAAGFTLEGTAYQAQNQLLQIHWQKTVPTPNMEWKRDAIKTIARETVREYLSQKNQPEKYLQLHLAILQELAQKHVLAQVGLKLPGNHITSLQTTLNELFESEMSIRRYKSSARNIESGLWGLWKPDPDQLTQNEKIEKTLISMLQEQQQVCEKVLTKQLCETFPGLQTPDFSFLHACLLSYAHPDINLPGKWLLNHQDQSGVRCSEVETIKDELAHLGAKFGFAIERNRELHWTDENRQVRFQFVVKASSIISPHLAAKIAGAHAILVIPGSRANLLAYKLNRDPYLEERLAKDWHVLKFRHLRHLLGLPMLTPEIFLSLLSDDPVEPKSMQQLPFFADF
jgi:hypothetical protein